MPTFLTIFGTRPEAIKLAPVIAELRAHPNCKVCVCVTGQHRELLDQVLNFFKITPDYDLALMQPSQDLSNFVARAVPKLQEVLKATKPEWVLVQGDTTSAFVGALAAYYQGIKVAHVEAGLRTEDLYSPFPEEGNRRMISAITTKHFAATESARDALLKENYENATVIITGNPVVDALAHVSSLLPSRAGEVSKQKVLLTIHRRENMGENLANVFSAIKQLADELPQVEFNYPVHPNPEIQKMAHAMLYGHPRIHLLKALPYPEFVRELKEATLVLTDSGGLQEEAPALGKPVLVLRKNTERKESVDNGYATLVGTDTNRIVAEVKSILNNPAKLERLNKAAYLYGGGDAAKRIVESLLE